MSDAQIVTALVVFGVIVALLHVWRVFNLHYQRRGAG